jgi:hypothetical protein
MVLSLLFTYKEEVLSFVKHWRIKKIKILKVIVYFSWVSYLFDGEWLGYMLLTWKVVHVR